MYRVTGEAKHFVDNSWDPPSDPAILPCSPNVPKDYLSKARVARERLAEKHRALKEAKENNK